MLSYIVQPVHTDIMAQQPHDKKKGEKNIIININDQEKSYNKAKLQQFEYFQTYFSKRWQTGDKEKSMKKSNRINVGKHLFSLNELDELMKICKTNSIDPNLRYQDFVKLIECDLYFGSGSITADTIVNFLELS